MKNLFGTTILVIFFGLSFSACSENDNDTVSNQDLIKGTWIVEQMDGEKAETDKIFVMTLADDGHQVYSVGQTIVNGKEWQEGNEYIYTFNGNILKVTGTASTGETTYLEVEVMDLTADRMVYVTKKLLIGGKTIQDPIVYTFRRKKADFESALIGCWKGHETTIGTSSIYDNYWVYNSDNTFDYIYFDEQANKYVKKADNNGSYYIYGDFLATSFTNKMDTDIIGRSFECWNIVIKEDTMNWTALRNGKEMSFIMTRSELPN